MGVEDPAVGLRVLEPGDMASMGFEDVRNGGGYADLAEAGLPTSD